MGHYELYNVAASKSTELYHHGIKGQKWGVRRAEKRANKRAARSAKAESAIQRSGGKKGKAAWKRVGRSALRYIGQNFLAGAAMGSLIAAGMSTVAAPPMAALYVASMGNMALNVQNAYSTVRDVWDIASHADLSEFLKHNYTLTTKTLIH